MSREGRFYITTPIYYASGEPHLGHAYSTLLTDVIARFYRQAGDEVRFLTGTDDHGQKMQEEAARRGISPVELCEEMASRFKAAWARLDVSADRFIRTTEAEHVDLVRTLYARLWESGDIYAADYRGWYCVPDERYWTEKDLGPDKTCPECGRPLQLIEEKNYFFRMSNYQERLVRHIREHPDWIVPESRKNEILGFLAKPLEDLSVSRPKSRVSWGIELPFDPEHVAYVWIDALINYVTGSGLFPWDDRASEEGWWPADLHVVGKDILTTHAVYWPTWLMAAELPLPKQILAHGWWVSDGKKMSKSLGNVVDPLQLQDQFGTDAVRWYLMREMTVGADASFTGDRFLMRYEELANVLGNLASRTTSMIARYRGGNVPEAPGTGLDEVVASTLPAYREAFAGLKVHEAMHEAMELARRANQYVEERQPWAQAKAADEEGLDETLATLYRTLVWLSAFFEPVMPGKMSILAQDLGLDAVPTLDQASNQSGSGRKVTRAEPMFPKQE